MAHGIFFIIFFHEKHFTWKNSLWKKQKINGREKIHFQKFMKKFFREKSHFEKNEKKRVMKKFTLKYLWKNLYLHDVDNKDFDRGIRGILFFPNT